MSHLYNKLTLVSIFCYNTCEGMNFTHKSVNNYHSRNLFCHLNIHSHHPAADPESVLGNSLLLIRCSIHYTIYEDSPYPLG